MRIFPINVIKSIARNTDNRIKVMQSLIGQTIDTPMSKEPIKFEALFTTEGINVVTEWDKFFQEIKDRKPSLWETPVVKIGEKPSPSNEEEISLSDQQAYRLAYYFHFVAQFYTHFGDESDKTYLLAVEYFFQKFQAEVGFRDEEILFKKGFKA